MLSLFYTKGLPPHKPIKLKNVEVYREGVYDSIQRSEREVTLINMIIQDLESLMRKKEK